MDPFVWHQEEMVSLFYVYDCIMFIPYKDITDGVYASLQAHFKIEDDGELKNYLRIELDRRPYCSIHLRHP